MELSVERRRRRLDPVAHRQDFGVEAVTDRSPDPPRLPQGDDDRHRTEDDETPRTLLLERLLKREEDDRSDDRPFDGAESSDHRHEEHLGRPLETEDAGGLDG